MMSATSPIPRPRLPRRRGLLALAAGAGTAAAVTMGAAPGAHAAPATLVNVEVQQATNGTILSIPGSGSVSYYAAGAWHPITTQDANNRSIVQAQIAPGTYTFAATYNGTRQAQVVTVGSSPQTVYFHTALVNVELQAHDGSILSIPGNGSASYYAGTWRPVTTRDANNPSIVQAQMLPGSYSFAATYNGTRQQNVFTVAVPNIYSKAGATQTVYFHTELVDVELQCWPAPGVTSSCGNRGDILAGSASYYAGTWRPISEPDANNPKITQAEMLPGTYTFAAGYDGTTQQQKATVEQPDPNLPGKDNTQIVYFHYQGGLTNQAPPAITVDEQVSADGGQTWVEVGDGNLAGAPQVLPGAIIDKRVIVTNTSPAGDLPVTAASVTDTNQPGVAGFTFAGTPTFTLQPGASLTSDAVQVTANQGVTDTATVTGTVAGAPDGSSTVSASDQTTYAVLQPAVTVDEQISVDGGQTWLQAGVDNLMDPPTAPVGGTVQERVIVSNTGAAPIGSVEVTEAGEPGVAGYTFAGASTAGLAPGQSLTSDVVTTTAAPPAGAVTGIATLGGYAADAYGNQATVSASDQVTYTVG